MWTEKWSEPEFDPDDMKLPPTLPDTPKVRAAIAWMYTHIERSDSELGELLQQLEDDGLADTTYVFHWSDHGSLPRGKRWPYDSGIHVPLIVRGSNIKPGLVNSDLVSTVDLGPTVMSLAGINIPNHVQGRAFLGSQNGPPRDYVYATRDRHDESYDMVRAVRDKRFKYIRNYRPDLPYFLWVPYLNRHPIAQEMWRLHMAGGLDETQSLMFQSPRPVEELYDTEADPHEIYNLVADLNYVTDLTRLRDALDRWLREVGDMGEIAESEMVRQWYPDGEQPETAAPVFIPVCAENPGIEPALEGGAFTPPVLVQIHCATQGASIAYTTGTGDKPHWLLYTGPLQLAHGETSLRSRAIRIGYRESNETQSNFTIDAEQNPAGDK